MKDPAPKLEDIAPHITRRMHGKNGSVTMHYHDGILKKVEISTSEDVRTLPRSA